jgi:YVTN family beta-propeller protein
MVVDPANGHLLGEITGLNRAHGVAFAYRTGHGFITSGGDSSVVMFDLKTLKVLGRTIAAVDCDAILYDPATGHIFTFNGDAGSSSVIDATTGKRIATIPLPGKPEFGVTAGNGKLYVNIEDRSEVAEIDARAMRVTRHWSIAPCISPSGLAVDAAHERLFSGCHSKVMGISDAVAGKLIATVPIGNGVDADRFDPATQYAFASTGDGMLTVVHEDTPAKFTLVDNIATMPGARTMEIDPQTHRVYTVSAQFGPAPAAVAGRRSRPPMIPGTFTLLVLER